MFQLVACLTILLIVVLTSSIFFRPCLALPLVISLYAVEQILMRFHPFFQYHPSFYNYFIGVVCSVSILIGVKRNGFPRAFFSLAFFLLFGLLSLSWCSYLWTPAPKAALHALVHFTLEAPLVFLLPIFTIMTKRDYKIIAVATVAFAFLISLLVIFSPVQGISGRCLLVTGGTVLSPATAILTAIVFFVFTHNYKGNNLYTILYFSIIVVLLFGLFRFGARVQFFLALFVVGVAVFFLVEGIQKIVIVGVVLSSVLIIGLFVSFSGKSISSVYDNSHIVNKHRSNRFSSDDFLRGLSQRIEMVKLCLTLESPVMGNGVMSWSHKVTGKDEYHYPHNSLAEIYYELGLLGLFLFLAFNYLGVKKGLVFYKMNKNNYFFGKIGLMFLCYWLCAFTLSFKQSTFMAALGIYCSIGMMVAAETRQTLDGNQN